MALQRAESARPVWPREAEYRSHRRYARPGPRSGYVRHGIGDERDGRSPQDGSGEVSDPQRTKNGRVAGRAIFVPASRRMHATWRRKVRLVEAHAGHWLDEARWLYTGLGHGHMLLGRCTLSRGGEPTTPRRWNGAR